MIELCYTLVVPQCLVLALVIGRVSTWNNRNHKLLLNFVLPHLPFSLSRRSGYNQILTPTLPYDKYIWHTNVSKSQILLESAVNLSHCCASMQCLLLALDRVTTLLSTNQMSTPTLPLQDGREGNVLPFCMKMILPSFLRHQCSFWTRSLFPTGS